MPIVRLSGSVGGQKDPNRKRRAKLLYRLFEDGWDIYNSNGDQSITLGNIQKKIIECDAFVFCPGASLRDMFKAASIIVGLQTNDADLLGKATVIQNCDQSWDPFISLISHLHQIGTVKQEVDEFLNVVRKPREVLDILNTEYAKYHPVHEGHNEPDIYEEDEYDSHEALVGASANKPNYNVCVFCSASIIKPDYLQQGYQLGKDLAGAGWGCVSGAGRTGIMGEVVRGAIENNGWAGGSNVPHIIAMEGLPDGLTEFWPRGDIYTRMEVMIEESDAFVIMPGGTGTVQEVLALVALKLDQHDLMQGKPILIVNRETDQDIRFWDPLIAMLHDHGAEGMFEVITSPDEVVTTLASLKG